MVISITATVTQQREVATLAVLRATITTACETDSLGGTPHPVIVTIRDNKDYIRVLLYSSYTTITGWGVLLTDSTRGQSSEGEPHRQATAPATIKRAMRRLTN